MNAKFKDQKLYIVSQEENKKVLGATWGFLIFVLKRNLMNLIYLKKQQKCKTL